ncbi:MAG: STAS domain-containing protein [gamma proteobacterium endosymbiont of Lamellibrachia anaximandri]|nr:STAS domain-containing protein [gamma proteobacterium endosymbiont of Lamellibrachia anaximandri]
MSISKSISSDGSKVTIAVAGRFDFSTHQDFIKAYKEQPKGEKEYIVDLSNAEYMDSSAMGMLLQLREHSSKKPGSVVLVNGNEAIQDILRIANFSSLFTIQ